MCAVYNIYMYILVIQWGVLDELGGLFDVLRNAGGLQAAAGVERTVRIISKDQIILFIIYKIAYNCHL